MIGAARSSGTTNVYPRSMSAKAPVLASATASHGHRCWTSNPATSRTPNTHQSLGMSPPIWTVASTSASATAALISHRGTGPTGSERLGAMVRRRGTSRDSRKADQRGRTISQAASANAPTSTQPDSSSFRNINATSAHPNGTPTSSSQRCHGARLLRRSARVDTVRWYGPAAQGESD